MKNSYLINAGKLIAYDGGFRNYEIFYNRIAAIRYFKSSPRRGQIDAFGIGVNGRRFAFCMMYRDGRKVITQEREYVKVYRQVN
jgi:hypothetical protein